MAKGKLTKRMWTEAALRTIARDGIAAVSIDRLAKELGATRGSFYWHFKDHSALLDHAMEMWDELETSRVEDAIATISDAADRLRANFLHALQDVDDPIPGLEPAIYAQPGHPAVAPAIRRVTERRLDILTHGYADLGLSQQAARRHAVLTYATYLGWLQLSRTCGDVVPEVVPGAPEAGAMLDHVIEQLIERPGRAVPE